MSDRSIHIRPRADGSWTVELDETRIELSRHEEVHEARMAAAGHAHALGIRDVVLHDRYHGVHPTPSRDMPSGHVPSSGTRE